MELILTYLRGQGAEEMHQICLVNCDSWSYTLKSWTLVCLNLRNHSEKSYFLQIGSDMLLSLFIIFISRAQKFHIAMVKLLKVKIWYLLKQYNS